MSKRPARPLQDPRVMTAVLVLLAIVVVVRLGDILPDRQTLASEIAARPELTPPEDLNLVSRDAVYYLTQSGSGAEQSLAALSPNAKSPRNPFEYQRSSKRRSKPSRGRNESLVCSAIFISGGPATALVGGRVLSAGDRIGKYRVERIVTSGVYLMNQGRRHFLPLAGSRNRSGPAGLAVLQRQ